MSVNDRSRRPVLRTLCSLRWLAVGGQAATILVATWVLGLPLPQLPLWAGVAVLTLFNIYTQLRPEAADTAPLTAFGHILVDVIILTWMVGWSGGMANPFSSLFLILIALAAFALPLRWALAVALACLLGYAASGIFGQSLPDGYSARRTSTAGAWSPIPDSAAVVLAFSTRLALALRQRELELSALRERFARNEGIVALATHAASVAHELNTPLATMTLLADDVAERSEEPEVREDMEPCASCWCSAVSACWRWPHRPRPMRPDAAIPARSRCWSNGAWCDRPSTCTATTMRRCGCRSTRAWATC